MTKKKCCTFSPTQLKVFGVEEHDEKNLDAAILEAVFDSVTSISAQLNLTLAMNRVDVAKEHIFIESRKDDLNASC